MLIHTSLLQKHAIKLAMQPFFHEYIEGLNRAYKLPVGAIIGKVKLVVTAHTEWLTNFDMEALTDEHRMFVPNKLTDQEKAFGDYSSGRYRWLFDNPV